MHTLNFSCSKLSDLCWKVNNQGISTALLVPKLPHTTRKLLNLSQGICTDSAAQRYQIGWQNSKLTPLGHIETWQLCLYAAYPQSKHTHTKQQQQQSSSGGKKKSTANLQLLTVFSTASHLCSFANAGGVIQEGWLARRVGEWVTNFHYVVIHSHHPGWNL